MSTIGSRKSVANIVNLISSTIVLASGIALAVLTDLALRQITDVVKRETGFTVSLFKELWAIGFIFIIPGFIGLLASLVNKRGGFLTEIVINVIALIILIGLFALGLGSATAKRSMFDSRTCNLVDDTCTCDTTSLKTLITLGFTCNEISSLIGLAVGNDAVTIVGGVFLLIAAVNLGNYVCCMKEGQGQVLDNSHQLTYLQGTTLTAPYQMQPVTNPGYIPQPAPLVKPPSSELHRF